MKGAWKKVTGTMMASDGSRGERRGSASKEPSSPLAATGVQDGATSTGSGSGSLLGKLRQTVAAAQVSHSMMLGTPLGTSPERKKVCIWPEWNDADVNAEKWDASGTHKGKEDKKGKSPIVQSAYFEDPDGKLDMPASLRVDHWKRPHDFMGEDKTPVVVDMDEMDNSFDIFTNNTHLHGSEFLRCFISQVTALWDLCVDKNQAVATELSVAEDPALQQPVHTWRPWEHIYSLCKVVKNHMPLYNPYGKYMVRLYWMGCWRKVQVDDLLPFNENDQLLLPVTMLSHELWPMLLAKALIKVASLDYSGGNLGQEYGDMVILHNLTGWLPEAIPLHTPPSYSTGQVLDQYYNLLTTHNVTMCKDSDRRHSHLSETWELLKSLLPEWRLPELTEPDKSEETIDVPQSPSIAEISREKLEAVRESSRETLHHKEHRADSTFRERSRDSLKERVGKEKGAKHDDGHKHDSQKSGRDSREDKKDKKEKDKDKDKDKKEKAPVIVEEPPVIPEKPEVVIFAMFGGLGKPVKVSQLARMADASERLRQNGLSHLYPHPVCITQTRCCPLELPPPPEAVPAWKLIRPRKKKERPTDEPKVEEEPPKEIQCLEISSPFVNYNVSALPIPTSTTRTLGHLERGVLRTRSKRAMSIEEKDELAAEHEGAGEEPAPPIPSEMEIPLVQPPSDREVPEETEESKGRKGKPRSAKREKPAESGEMSGSQSKGHRAEKTSPKLEPRGKGVRKSDSRPFKREDEGDRKDGGKEKVDREPEGLQSIVIEEERLEDRLPNREEPPPQTSKQNACWIDFDQFCICFRTLYIFHKPATYICNQRCSDLKHVSQAAPPTPAKGEKKQTVSSSGGVVDSLDPVEIVIAYSVLPRWFEQPTVTDEKRPVARTRDRDSDNSWNSVQENALPMVSPRDPPAPPPVVVTPGTLVAEPYSWKSLVTGQPIVRLRTTGIRAAVLTLPPGRHVLKLMMTSPLAHHVHMCSTVSFVLGDEETIMPYLVHESSRFKDNAVQVMGALGLCISVWSDGQQLAEAWQHLQALHCPFAASKRSSTRQHYQHFREALYSMLRRALREAATPEMALGWRAFNFDVLTPNILGLPLGPRPERGADDTAVGQKQTKKPQWPVVEDRGSQSLKKHVESKPSSEPEKTEYAWMSRYLEPTAEEQVAALKIQKAWRGFWVRKVRKAAIPGTVENTKAEDHLLKSWVLVDTNLEDNGLFLFRELFKRTPDTLQFYPFNNDEWNRVSYNDYRGVFLEQNPNTWFIVFRDIFYVKEETLAVPRIYIPIPTCMLRVIDNDTGHQLPTVFQKVAPYVYKQNKKGYTFVVEARTIGLPLNSGTWRMRLIGSFSTLPAPRTAEVNSSFHTRELQDYYLPNPKDILFRYCVKVAEDQLCSLQVSTSKVDVYLRLCVLDHEEELASATGKGHVVIPAFIFQKDVLPTADDSVHPSLSQGDPRQTSKNGQRVTSGKGVKGKNNSPLKSPEEKASRESGTSSDPTLSEAVELKLHKYIVQATVLKSSWPLSRDDQAFVNKLKEEEKNELKAGGGAVERPPSPPKLDKPSALKSKLKSKGAKDKQDPAAMPATTVLYPDRPFWTLRLVVDAAAAEDLEVKKDTERVDEIRAMKKAWEEAEPGRALKAHLSRQQFLLSHAVSQCPEEEAGKEGTEATKEGTEATKEGTVAGKEGTKAGKGGTEGGKEGTEAGKEGTEGGKEGMEASKESMRPSSPVTPDIHFSVPEFSTVRSQLSWEFSPQATSSRKKLQSIDMTPFLRGGGDKTLYVDEAEEQLQLAEKEKAIAEFRAQRQEVEAWRAQDKVARNLTKLRQLEEAQALQTMVDKKREMVNVPREAIRQVHLEAERKRQEELAQQEALLRAEMEAAKAEKKSNKGAKGKKKK